MRAVRARYPHTSTLRRTSRTTSVTPPSPGSRTASEHAAIAAASAKWELAVVAGLQTFVGKSIPLTTGESLRVTHVLPLAGDETLSGWYNWRGLTNPDAVLLGTLVGGAQNGTPAAMAVDAKLSARSGKLQVLTSTLEQLLEPFQPLANLVDATLGPGVRDRLALRDGFHVVRGVATTIDTAAKSTRALHDPEFAEAWEASQPAPVPKPVTLARTAPTKRVAAERVPDRRPPAPRRAALATPQPVASASTPTPLTPAAPRTAPATAAALSDADTALLREAVWAFDALAMARADMPEPEGVYTLTDVLALDGYRDAPAAFVLLGRHGRENIAQAVVLGKAPMPTDAAVTATLAVLPGRTRGTRYRVVSPFRVVPGRADTLTVLAVRRTLVLTA